MDTLTLDQIAPTTPEIDPELRKEIAIRTAGLVRQAMLDSDDPDSDEDMVITLLAGACMVSAIAEARGADPEEIIRFVMRANEANQFDTNDDPEVAEAFNEAFAARELNRSSNGL